MNFFQQQDEARRNTRWLVLLFILAVVSLIVLTNLFLVVFPWQWNAAAFSDNGANHDVMCLFNEQCSFWQQLNWTRIAYVSLTITSIIAMVSLFKWIQIRQGGKAVAEMMGGTQVEATTQDFAEKRLLNVVEEMALAANMPVPAMYVLRQEQGINAFAAGFTTRDAVVAVTKGALNSFNRDQLQGVVAHEFSHILNGDMRLNMKLIAILHGILFISEAGYAFLRTGRHSTRRNNDGPIVLLGLGLLILGFLGSFFGHLIKAAVSRQREFLADASAVQFTRNPNGIADALKIIGGSQHGSQVRHSHSAELSHLFFGSSLAKVSSWMATHPPLDERIKRIEPHWRGDYVQHEPKVERSYSELPTNNNPSQRRAADALMAASALGVSSATQYNLDPKSLMLDKLHDPITAASVLVCLIYQPDNTAQKALVEELNASWPELYQAVNSSIWMKWAREDFLPIVNLAASGLRLLTIAQYRDYKRFIMKLMQADGGIDLYEWALFQMLRNSMDSHFERAVYRAEKYRNIGEMAQDMQKVLVTVIQAGSSTEEHKKHTYHATCANWGIDGTNWEKVSQTPISEFSLAINKIALAFPLLKPRILKGLIAAVKADGVIDVIERQTIMAISASIDVPMPESLLNELAATL